MINKLQELNWAVWVYSLFSAFITGLATSFLSAIGISGAQAVGIQVDQLQPRQLCVVAIFGGLVGAMSFLKQSPLPPAEKDGKADSAGKIVSLLLGGCLIWGLWTGCASTGLDPDRAGMDLRILTRTGALVAMNKDGNARYYLAAAVQVLNASLAEGNYSPDQLRAALAAMPVDELESPWVRFFITDAIDIYRVHFAKIDASRAGPLVAGIRDGIRDALTDQF
jgi:hypothetical protein